MTETKPTVEYFAELLRRSTKAPSVFWLALDGKVAFTRYKTNQSHTRGFGESIAIRDFDFFKSVKKGGHGCVPNKYMSQCGRCKNYTRTKKKGTTICNYCGYIIYNVPKTDDTKAR
jgi:hypothetical protein